MKRYIHRTFFCFFGILALQVTPFLTCSSVSATEKHKFMSGAVPFDQRYKHGVEVGFAAVAQISFLEFYNGAIDRNWNNLANLGFEGFVKVNFANRFWTQINLGYTNLFGGLGTQFGPSVFTQQSVAMNGLNYDAKGILAFDFFRFRDILQLSLYGGVYYRGFQYGMGIGRSSNNGSSFTDITDKHSQLNVGNFITGAIGLQVLHNISRKAKTTTFMELYLGTFLGSHTSSGSVPSTITAGTKFTSSAFAIGAGVGTTISIETIRDLWVNITAKYQILQTISDMKVGDTVTRGSFERFWNVSFLIGVSYMI